jgi:hypothetical protein
MTKSCVIFGNGPSLNRMPSNMLEVFPSFGMNYAPLQPTYYVCIDSDVITKNPDSIRPLVQGAEIAFLSELLVGVNDLYDGANVRLVSKDTQSFKAEQYMSGFTAAYVALKMAYYLGYNEVHLYGIDHSLDWAHYRPDYPAGAKDRARRLAVMETHYQLAANVYARAGRRIINHSNPSRLDKIFRRS